MSTGLPTAEYSESRPTTEHLRMFSALRLNFQITFSGKQIYDLLRLLEKEAIDSGDYTHVRESVLFAELVREQAKRQGF